MDRSTLTPTNTNTSCRIFDSSVSYALKRNGIEVMAIGLLEIHRMGQITPSKRA